LRGTRQAIADPGEPKKARKPKKARPGETAAEEGVGFGPVDAHRLRQHGFPHGKLADRLAARRQNPEAPRRWRCVLIDGRPGRRRVNRRQRGQDRTEAKEHHSGTPMPHYACPAVT